MAVKKLLKKIRWIHSFTPKNYLKKKNSCSKSILYTAPITQTALSRKDLFCLKLLTTI